MLYHQWLRSQRTLTAPAAQQWPSPIFTSACLAPAPSHQIMPQLLSLTPNRVSTYVVLRCCQCVSCLSSAVATSSLPLSLSSPRPIIMLSFSAMSAAAARRSSSGSADRRVRAPAAQTDKSGYKTACSAHRQSRNLAPPNFQHQACCYCC